MPALLYGGLVCTLIYCVILALLYSQQRNLLYLPDRSDLEPARLAGDDWRLITSHTADGIELQHLHRPGSSPAAPAVLVFHGNGGHAGHRADKYADLLGPDHSLILAEYRGYGGNPGQPTEQGLLQDARSLLAWAEGEGLTPDRVVLYGESLGSGVATALAAEQGASNTPFAGVVLESPFDSLAAVAQHHYWYVPARWLLHDQFSSARVIQRIGAPLLVLHAVHDSVVPIQHGKRLFEAAAQPKQFIEIEGGAGHADLYQHPRYGSAVQEFLTGLQ